MLKTAEAGTEIAMWLNQAQPFTLIESYPAPVTLQISAHGPILPDSDEFHPHLRLGTRPLVMVFRTVEPLSGR